MLFRSLAGVWIEISILVQNVCLMVVTPLAGVWIEIPAALQYVQLIRCHSPCGSVD